MRKLIFIIAIALSFSSFSQELNCEVIVNAQLTGNENVQVFKTLERQIREFVNNTSWTNKTFKPQERINCNMVINVNDYNNDVFTGAIQIQSSRPVFGDVEFLVLDLSKIFLRASVVDLSGLGSGFLTTSSATFN